MKYCVIDLETMGTGGNTAIVSLGAVILESDDGQIEKTFHCNISLESSLKAGLKVTADTIMWWLKQNEDARDALIYPKPCDLAIVLDEFSTFFTSNGCDYLVGNGSSFDNAILSDAYKALDISQCWHYASDRCLRTYMEASGYPERPKREGTYHSALDDAMYQAECLKLYLNELKHIQTSKEEIAQLEKQLSIARIGLERLANLGNETHFGNNDCNRIAQKALEDLVV